VKDDGERIMGYVFAYRSVRNPYRRRSNTSPVDPWQYFGGMPVEFRRMVDESDIRREAEGPGDRCIVTAVFWSGDDRLTAAEPWSMVLRHSANAVRDLLDQTEHPDDWLSGDNPVDGELQRSLYRRKTALGREPLVLGPDDRAQILRAVAPFWEHQRKTAREVLYPRTPSPPPLEEFMAAYEATWLTLDGARQELAKVGILLP
jgi:hypothetical protein